jgi:hypothetical protein
LAVTLNELGDPLVDIYTIFIARFQGGLPQYCFGLGAYRQQMMKNMTISKFVRGIYYEFLGD